MFAMAFVIVTAAAMTRTSVTANYLATTAFKVAECD